MTSASIYLIESDFRRFPGLRAEPVAPDEFDHAVEMLPQAMDPQYRDFIIRYGGAILGPLPIFGLRRPEHMPRRPGDVVQATTSFRSKGWPGTDLWAVISMDQAGNPIGLASDGSIQTSDHDDAFRIERVADCFDHFVDRCVRRDRG